MAWTDMTQLTNCYAWYKPESLASSYANGDPISSWADSSGNGRDISQATSVSQPLALANAVNGYMAADFGGNDFLSSASYTQSGDVVACIILSLDTTKDYNAILSIEADSSPSWNNGTSTWISLFTRSGANFSNFIHNGSGYVMFHTEGEIYSHTTSQYMIITSALNSKTAVFRESGENTPYGLESKSSSTTFVSPPSGTAYIHLGYNGLSSSYLDGKIAEVVIFDSVNRACEEVAWVEGYLADKYAITLPAGHLFKNEPPANAPTTYNSSGGGGATEEAGTQVFPFNQWVTPAVPEAILHPLRSS